MPQVPAPVEGTPNLPYQPYDASAEGTSDTAPGPGQVYDGNSGADPTGWEKLRDGGAADMSSGRVTGGWPDNGTSDGSAWKQT
jgi:hypothetical protein